MRATVLLQHLLRSLQREDEQWVQREKKASLIRTGAVVLHVSHLRTNQCMITALEYQRLSHTHTYVKSHSAAPGHSEGNSFMNAIWKIDNRSLSLGLADMLLFSVYPISQIFATG